MLRCTDPVSGKISYTDGSCDPGQARKEVAPKPSDEELARQNAQAEEALRLRRARQESDDAAAPARSLQAPAATAPDPAQSPQCAQAKAELQAALARDITLYDTNTRIAQARQAMELACLTPDEYARAQARHGNRAVYEVPAYAPPVIVVPPARPHRPHQEPPRPKMLRCDVFRCYDQQGKTYPR
ncbi:DUF4124 domain-containing protein [Comamonas sp. NLF-1-9]|uniref:DUF4124 domain-containing protein n=1 Tax=Comamonas sp. NLF-1-9 TaxID=2853163 RepID=UPI001C452919|nr:DUF4124 domain-containing protein [Comamonas sp. NLF-1-9]QXL85160.1 DUF4124 domain-containing protein [Comamonas sp. NLF-1-9]